MVVVVVADPVDVTVEFEVEVAVAVEAGSVTVLSGWVVVVVMVVVVVPPLTCSVVVTVVTTVFFFVTLHRCLNRVPFPLTSLERHFAGTVLGPAAAEKATPTGTSSTIETIVSPKARMREERFTGLLSPS